MVANSTADRPAIFALYIVSGGIGIIYLDRVSASLISCDPRRELKSSHAHNPHATGFNIIRVEGDQKFLDGTRHVIYPWNQSKI